MCVSIRWIDYCIEKNTVFTKFESKIFLALIPFPHSVPFKDFNNITFCTSGYIEEEKEFIKRFGMALGAKYSTTM